VKQHQGIWLPDHEQHLIEWMNKSGEIVDGRGTYQIKKLRAALEHVRNWRVAVDVGAHVGFWSMHLAKKFAVVHAFEPMMEHRQCWTANERECGLVAHMCDGQDEERVLAELYASGHLKGPVLHGCALGAEPGRVSLTVPPGSSGGTHVNGAGEIEVRTLDSFRLNDVDFLKIDCEGYELQVLQGAVETLERCRPTIIVEQKAHTPGGQKHLAAGGKPAVDFVLGLGAKLRREISGDFILAFD
jgi:hypothetical protein